VSSARLALLVALAGGGCFQPPVAAGPSAQDAPASEVVVETSAGSVSLRVGQTLRVRRPGGDALQWQMTGADDILERVEPTGEQPVGPEGWKLRGKAAGDGELTFTGHQSVTCADPPRCPPAPPSPPALTLTVHVAR